MNIVYLLRPVVRPGCEPDMQPARHLCSASCIPPLFQVRENKSWLCKFKYAILMENKLVFLSNITNLFAYKIRDFFKAILLFLHICSDQRLPSFLVKRAACFMPGLNLWKRQG